MPRFLLPALALVLAPGAPAQAAPECKDLQDFIRTETDGAQKYVDIFTFRKNGRGDNVLLLFKDTTERGQPPERWLFVNRPSPDTTGYCVRGRGESFEQLNDKPQLLYAGEFGLPGSDKPNCATSTAHMPASDVLRAYANRSLGDDMVLHAIPDDGPEFQFAINNNQDWVIIQDNDGNPKTSCLYDEGNDVFMKFNNHVPAP